MTDHKDESQTKRSCSIMEEARAEFAKDPDNELVADCEVESHRDSETGEFIKVRVFAFAWPKLTWTFRDCIDDEDVFSVDCASTMTDAQLDAPHTCHMIHWVIECDTPFAVGGGGKWHPFDSVARSHQFAVEERTAIGNVVACNQVSRVLIEYICKSDAELEGQTGSTCPSAYRQRLIQSLYDLWD